MQNTNTPLLISHYSDVLCVWAYVSQIRINELLENFGDKLKVEYLYFQVFGNALEKIDNNWKDKGGRAGYSEHVKQVVEQFGHLPVSDNVWLDNPSTSSLPAHLYICASQILEQDEVVANGSSEQLAWAFRHAFFAEGKDISCKKAIRGIIEQQQLPLDKLEEHIDTGRAFARLSAQMQRAVDGIVRASPTLSFNDDRQRLTGNVGYRIIESNVRELLERPDMQQTWC